MEPTAHSSPIIGFIKRRWKLILIWVLGILAVLILLITLLFYVAARYVEPSEERSDEVLNFVHDFEEALPLVKLDALPADAAVAMEEHYAPFVARELLDAWKADPKIALGDAAGPSAPAGIRIKSMKSVGILSYVVKAYVKEETPVTLGGASGVAKTEYPITLGIAQRNGAWRVVEYSEGHAGEEAEVAP